MFPLKRVDVINDIASSFLPMTIMDIGCGACTVADIFSKHGHYVHVSDIVDHRVPEKWSQKFTKFSATKVPLEGYECVILAGLLYHLSLESQAKVCDRLRGKLVFLDTHYIESEENGEPRNRTESSEPLPVIPSIKYIREKLFPGHFVMQTKKHTEDRSWFVCVPREEKLHYDRATI